ncbi:MAG: sigma-54 dependent transcriptional regulator [Pseudomonadaceae bacterium]|nr:sigma-54 dependent transcriptional regulator [Pseudomonadaceae bacterium]
MAALAQCQSLLTQKLRHPESGSVFSRYVGVSDAAVDTRAQMAAAAGKDVTVLVTGESGTGKEVVARALHAGSRRESGPFVPVNCGAIPAELLESELFGHEKGAFTGAISQKTGRFELAHGGTLFLDEIGDLPYPMQVKVLRAIEQKSFERVGGVNTRVSDVRIVAATNKNLESLIESGDFREDLFYRLNVFPIELAPLRKRAEDLPLLVNALTGRIQQEQGLHVRLSVDALAVLGGYSWPGNVRELANLLQRLAIQYPHALVRSQDLPKKYTESLPAKPTKSSAPAAGNLPDDNEVLLPVNGIDLKDYLARLEKSLIEQALEDTNAVVARAADRLHIRRTTLVEKMRKHGLGRVGDSV